MQQNITTIDDIVVDVLKIIFNFLGPQYLILLKSVNKEWKKISDDIQSVIFQKQLKNVDDFYKKGTKIEPTNSDLYFYSLVQDFIIRDDFEKLNIQFIFKRNITHPKIHTMFFSNCARFNLFELMKYINKKQNNKIKTKIDDNIFDVDCSWNEFTPTHFSYYGRLNFLKYIYENNYSWTKECCSNAVLNGHLECLKYLHENKCPWDEKSCSNAAWNGDLHILKYLHENKCPWDEKSCRYASLYGYLDILKYLHENNCPWDEWCFLYAIENNHLHVLKYLHEKKCPYEKQMCLNDAKNKKEIKEYIEKYM